MAREIFAHEPQLEVEFLDLSRLTSEYGRVIYPCKTCVSTAMPLCHWPCSCYPNHALGQVQDWMNDIYAMWAAAHGVMIICPVNWYGAPSGLKLMIDRLVCADGGNPDPTSTHGKKAEEAKALELAGWSYPQHLAGRVFSVVVHGDYGGTEMVHDAISRLAARQRPDRGRASVAARADDRLHAALRHQPRRTRPRHRLPGGSAQRRAVADRGGEAFAQRRNCSNRMRA